MGYQRAQLVQRDDVVHVGDGDGQTALLGRIVHRQQTVALGQFARHQAQGCRIDDGVTEVDRPLTERLAQGIAQRGFRDKAERDQQPPHRLVGLHLIEQRDAQLVFADDALRDQELADRAAMGDG